MPELTPDLISALAPYGASGLLLVLGYLVFAQLQKTKRVRMIAEAKKREGLDDVDL